MSAILLLIALLAAGGIEAAETCGRKLDLLISVDSSASVCGGTGHEVPQPCAAWYAILDFCKNIVNSLNIGPDETRVAFVTYSDTTNVEWGLRQYTNKTSLLAAIDNVKYPGGEFTDLLSVFKIISNIFLPVVGEDRLGVQNIGILISDGAPENPDQAYAAESTVIQGDGVGVFVVCLMDGCTVPFSWGIASPPKKVNETFFLVKDHLLIDQVRDNLVKKFCTWTLLGGIVQTVG